MPNNPIKGIARIRRARPCSTSDQRATSRCRDPGRATTTAAATVSPTHQSGRCSTAATINDERKDVGSRQLAQGPGQAIEDEVRQEVHAEPQQFDGGGRPLQPAEHLDLDQLDGPNRFGVLAHLEPGRHAFGQVPDMGHDADHPAGRGQLLNGSGHHIEGGRSRVCRKPSSRNIDSSLGASTGASSAIESASARARARGREECLATGQGPHVAALIGVVVIDHRKLAVGHGQRVGATGTSSRSQTVARPTMSSNASLSSQPSKPSAFR